MEPTVRKQTIFHFFTTEWSALQSLESRPTTHARLGPRSRRGGLPHGLHPQPLALAVRTRPVTAPPLPPTPRRHRTRARACLLKFTSTLTTTSLLTGACSKLSLKKCWKICGSVELSICVNFSQKSGTNETRMYIKVRRLQLFSSRVQYLGLLLTYCETSSLGNL